MNSAQSHQGVVPGSIWVLALSPLWSLLLFAGLAAAAGLREVNRVNAGLLVLLSGNALALACHLTFLHWCRTRAFPVSLARTAVLACALALAGGLVMAVGPCRGRQPGEDLIVGALIFAPTLIFTWALTYLALRRVEHPGVAAALCFGVAAFTLLLQLRFRAAPEVIQFLVVPSLVAVMAFFVWLIAFLSTSGPDRPLTAP